MKKSLFTLLLLSLLWFGCDEKEKADADPTTDLVSSSGTAYVRYNAATAEGQADVSAMAKAMSLMKEMPCDSTLSWYYMSAIHWVPDSILAKPNPYCPQYQTKADLLEAWDNCTHVNGDANSAYQFLIWHRLYIWHFEKIIRSLSGKADFALPYWRYVNPNFRTLPKELQNTTSSLYTASRLAGLNAGDSINSKFALINLTWATLKNNQAKTYSVFNDQIDAAPHGAMHDYIGGAWSNVPMFNPIYQGGPYTSTDTLFGEMSLVPSAGFDPVFWLHHSNIDFLWNEWENSPNGERPPLDSVVAHPWGFTFPEPDGTLKTYTMQEAYEAAFNPDYSYADSKPMILLTSERHKELITDAQLVVPQEGLVHEATLNEAVGTGTTVVPVAGELKNALMRGAEFVQAKSVAEGNFIIKITVSFTNEPSGGFAVYLAEGSDQANQSNFLGSMTFFGAAHHAGHGGHGGGLSKTFTFDATHELASAGDAFNLVFEKVGGDDTGIRITKVSVYQY